MSELVSIIMVNILFEDRKKPPVPALFSVK